MANIEVILPQMGEGVIEATITRWLKDVNNDVLEDEPIVEIATDKVDSEIPAPASGKLIKKFFTEGEIPKVGDIIAIISSLNGSTESVSILNENSINLSKPSSIDKADLDIKEEMFLPETNSNNTIEANSHLSPFIRHFAQQRGILRNELALLKGSGEGGTLTKDDVLKYFKSGKPVSVSKVESRSKYSEPIIETGEYKPMEGEEVFELDRTRKIIAERMQNSLRIAPHVTSFIDVDVTPIVQWREKYKKMFLVENGINLTYTPIVAEVVVQALKEFPGINVSLFGDKLIRKKNINIGIATALPDGNLIVPVIKGADKFNLVKLAKDIHDLAQRARNGKLNPGESQGGTFTITNLGQFGNVTGTPIINQPESAILAVGAIKKKPWVVNVNETQTIGIRDIVTLSMSYDHRIIDGALGGAFLSRIGYLLENQLPKI